MWNSFLLLQRLVRVSVLLGGSLSLVVAKGGIAAEETGSSIVAQGEEEVTVYSSSQEQPTRQEYTGRAQEERMNTSLEQPQGSELNTIEPEAVLLSELEHPAATMDEWVTQFAQADQPSPVQVTNVVLSPSESGVDIVLETDEGQLSSPVTQIVGDAFIADIDNVALSLPDGEDFQVANPADGIALVSVNALEGDRIRITVTGSDAPPDVNLAGTAQGLALTVVPGVATADRIPDEDAIQVIVSATRTEEPLLEIPRSVTIIEREEIEQQTFARNDLSTILGNLVPGLGPPTDSGSTRGQNLRGRTALILIDGIPQNTNTSFSTELTIIDPSTIERIEVVRGPSAVYGDGAAGGVINIITRPPVEEGFVGEAAVTLRPDIGNLADDGFGYRLQAGVSGREGQFDFRVNTALDVDQATFDARGNRIPPDGLSNDNRTIGVLGKLGYDLSETQRIQLGATFFNSNFESEFIPDPVVLTIPGLQRSEALRVGNLDFDDDPRQNVATVNLTYRNEDILNSQLDAQVYYRTFDLTQIPADIRGRFADELFPFAPRVFQTNLDVEEIGARLQFDTEITNNFSVLWGADFGREENEAPFNDIDPESFDEGDVEVIGTPTQTPPYTIRNVGAFAQLEWEPINEVILSGGLRYENIAADIDDFTGSPFTNFFEPPPDIEGGRVSSDDVVFNAGIVYRTTPNISLFFNFAQGFSFPNLDSFLGFLPEGTNIEDDFVLEPQKVNNYEVGVRGIWEQIEFSLAGFLTTSELGSALVVDPSGFTETVRAPQRNFGIEFTTDWRPTDRWLVGGSVTWNEGDFDPGDEGDFQPLSSIDVQPATIRLYIENETLPGWRTRIQSILVSDRSRAINAGTDFFDIDGYVLVDLISSLDIGPGQLQLGVENLLNVDYFPVSSQERIGIQELIRQAGRGRSLSLRYGLTF
ncbi:MAG: TonB-dependent receptor [Cyanobacteria bacterium J06633_2]